MNNYIIFRPKDTRLLYAITVLKDDPYFVSYRLDLNSSNNNEITFLVKTMIFNFKRHDRGQIIVELTSFGKHCEVIHFPLRDGGYILSGLRIPIE